MRIKIDRKTHPESFLNFQNAFNKDGPQLVSDPRQQEAKERDAKYGIKDAEDFPTLGTGSNVTVTCGNISNTKVRNGADELLHKRLKAKR